MHPPLDLEARLRAAAGEAAWPVTPDLRAGVLARIVEPARTSAGARVRSRAPRHRPLVRALALALVGLLALAGIAAALGFRLPGLDILRVDQLPASPRLAGAPVEMLDVVPGSPVPLEEARALDGAPRLLVPDGLPVPSTAFVEGTGDTRLVTLAWRATPGGPAITGTDLALIVGAAPGRIEAPLLTKVLGPGTTIEPVSVAGDAGWWISGAPHELLVRSPGGEATVLRARYAGDTLVFARDGTIYRMESALGRDATLEIAASLH